MRTSLVPFSLSLICLLTSACQIRIVDDGDDDVGESGDTSDDATESSDDSTDATDETETSETDTDTSGDQCPPPPESPATFEYEIDLGDDLDPFNTDIDWTCTVTQAGVGEGLDVTLDCPEALGAVHVSVVADPSFLPPIDTGATVQLSYVSEGPWWYNVRLRLDLEGFGHLLTLIDGDSIEAPEPFTFELPYPVEVVTGLCETSPGGCGDVERLGLRFTINSETSDLYDPYYAILGGDPGTEVWVAQATRLYDVQCTDTPDDWYRVLIADTGWE